MCVNKKQEEVTEVSKDKYETIRNPMRKTGELCD